MTDKLLPDTLQAAARRDAISVGRLSRLEFPVTVVLGQVRMRIRDILRFTAGSLVELDRREGELVEIMVREAVVARGEVVSIGGNYGLRIVEVMSREGRLALQSASATRARRGAQPASGTGRQEAA